MRENNKKQLLWFIICEKICQNTGANLLNAGECLDREKGHFKWFVLMNRRVKNVRPFPSENLMLKMHMKGAHGGQTCEWINGINARGAESYWTI